VFGHGHGEEDFSSQSWEVNLMGEVLMWEPDCDLDFVRGEAVFCSRFRVRVIVARRRGIRLDADGFLRVKMTCRVGIGT
jgi:hypothetical protein